LNWKILNSNSTAHTLLQPTIIYCIAQIGNQYLQSQRKCLTVQHTVQTTGKICALNIHTVLINLTNYHSTTLQGSRYQEKLSALKFITYNHHTISPSIKRWHAKQSLDFRFHLRCNTKHLILEGHQLM